MVYQYDEYDNQIDEYGNIVDTASSAEKSNRARAEEKGFNGALSSVEISNALRAKDAGFYGSPLSSSQIAQAQRSREAGLTGVFSSNEISQAKRAEGAGIPMEKGFQVPLSSSQIGQYKTWQERLEKDTGSTFVKNFTGSPIDLARGGGRTSSVARSAFEQMRERAARDADYANRTRGGLPLNPTREQYDARKAVEFQELYARSAHLPRRMGETDEQWQKRRIAYSLNPRIRARGIVDNQNRYIA